MVSTVTLVTAWRASLEITVKQVGGYNIIAVAAVVKQLLDEVEHDIVNYQNRGLCYLPKPKAAEAEG